MKLVIINGSPRGRASNSSILTDWLTSEIGDNVEVERDIFLKNLEKHREYIEKIKRVMC